MDVKDIKKIILLAICTFMIGFGCLIVYYINYSSETAARKNSSYETEILNQQDIINNIQSTQNNSDINSTKFGDGTIEYNYQEHDLDKYQAYVDEQLSLKTDKTEDEMEVIYSDIMKDIRIKLTSGDFAAASELAYKAVGEHTFIDGKQYSNISALKAVNGYLELSNKNKLSYISKIYDPAIYVILFYHMSPEYQVKALGSENFIYIPSIGDHQMSILSVEQAGPLESKASLYFSELETLDIFKVQIELYGVKYYVYVAGKLNYSYRITDIELVENDNNLYSTYTDYFNIWGKN